VLVKPESLQPTGAFKLRGAYAAITALSPQERQRGVVAHPSGNHGYALAYAAALLGVRAAIVVPRNAPEVKTSAIAAVAVAVAAALDGVDGIPQATPERPVVAVLSGGNISPKLLAEVLAGQNPSYTG
jgi:threonine dehydratase